MAWRCLEENLEPLPTKYMTRMFWFNSWIPKDGRVHLLVLGWYCIGIYPIYHVDLSLSLPIVAYLLKYLPMFGLSSNIISQYIIVSQCHITTSQYVPLEVRPNYKLWLKTMHTRWLLASEHFRISHCMPI